MPDFTVIGLYDDGQTFADHITAANEQDAMAIAAHNTRGASDLQILGAIDGTHNLVAACEDSGRAAYAADLCDPTSTGPGDYVECRQCGAPIDPGYARCVKCGTSRTA